MRVFRGVHSTWLVAAAVLAIGCGSGADVDSDGANVCSEMAKVACHNMYNCCSEGEIQDILGVGEPRTQSECQVDVSKLCERATATLADGVSKNRVRFDADTMNRCLDALVAPDDTCASVETSLPWAEECMNSAWIGLVADGGACLSSLECASLDSFCGPSQVCVARPTVGQPCGAIGCSRDAFCDFGVGMCRARRNAGEPCVGNGDCVPALFCDFTATTPTCAERRAVGEACTSNGGCQSGRCNPGTCSGSGTTCFTNSQCNSRCEDDGSFCSTDRDCGLGTCSVSQISCTSDFSCLDAADVCVFPVRCNTGECTGNIVCGENHQVIDYCEDALDDLPIPTGANVGSGAPPGGD